MGQLNVDRRLAMLARNHARKNFTDSIATMP